MRSRLVIPAILLLVGTGSAWFWLHRPHVIEPPLPDEPGELDPIVLQLIDRSVERVRETPRDARAWYWLGGAYHAHRLMPQAEACYQQASALDDDDPRPLYQLARVREFSGEHDSAVELVDQVIAMNDRYAPAHWRRGQWLVELGRLDEAEQSFGRALALEPDSALATHGLAGVLLQSRRFDEAVELIEGYVARHPLDTSMYPLLGTAYVGVGRVEEGRRLMSRAQGRKPPSDDEWGAEVVRLRTGYQAITMRARTLIEAGRPQQSLHELTELRAHYPDDTRVINLLASAHGAMGQLDESIRLYEQSVSINPDQFTAHLNLSFRYEHARRIDLALRHVNRAIENDPRKPEAHLQKGRLLIILQDFPGAAETLEEAVDRGANHPDDFVTLGQVLDRMERTQDAIGWFKRALAKNPDLASAHRGLAMARASLGDLDGALQALERSRELDPDAPFLEQAARIIQERAAQGPAPGGAAE